MLVAISADRVAREWCEVSFTMFYLVSVGVHRNGSRSHAFRYKAFLSELPADEASPEWCLRPQEIPREVRARNGFTCSRSYIQTRLDMPARKRSTTWWHEASGQRSIFARESTAECFRPCPRLHATTRPRCCCCCCCCCGRC